VDSKLAPGLLVAAPGLTCPFFHHTLILLVEHGEDGALGFVVNRPSETPVTSLLEGLEIEDLAEELEGEVWVGGPVAPDTGWVLFDPSTGDTSDVEAVELSERVAVSASPHFLEQLADGEGPEVFAVLLGYAGWGPGQLDDEIREGSWIWIDLDPALVFDVPVEERWRAGLASLGIDPARVVGLGVAEA
jgi:putative transcriptional regulator